MDESVSLNFLISRYLKPFSVATVYGIAFDPATTWADITDFKTERDELRMSLFLESIEKRVLVFDGAMGTTLHSLDLTLADYNNLENCCEILNLTRPDAIGSIHEKFLAVGSDAVMTNTFGASRHVLDDFDLGSQTVEINERAARIAREACDKYATPDKPRFVIGSMGPGTKLVTLGQITWDEMLASYTEQAKGLIKGGVDAFLVETCQDILQTKCAVVACTDAMEQAGVEIPIICTFTVETTGTMLVGTEALAAIVALDAYPQVKVIGMNCATGPQEMSEHVRVLSANSTRPILIQPNAGLPELVDSKPHFPLTPKEMAKWLVEFVEEDGVALVGGCCGTTPEHLQAVAEAMKGRAPKAREATLEPSCSSLYQAVNFRQDNALLSVGERTNANGSRKFKELLAANDLDGMIQVARTQVKHGSHVLDVCTAYVGRDEVADMTGLLKRAVGEVTVPLMIDSTEVPVIEAALKLAGGKCIINSINLEDGEEKLDAICKLARRHGAALVALTIDEEGMAKTADRKVEIAQRIHDLVTKRHGIRASDLIFDALTFTLGTGNEDDRKLGADTLEGIRRIKEAMPDCHAILGLSNVSFGLNPPVRKVLNSVFLHHAREVGLDSAIVHATGILPYYKIDDHQKKAAEDLIFDRRKDGYDPLMELIGLFDDAATASTEKKEKPTSVEERLKLRIIEGDRVGLEADLTEAMTTYTPLDIINDILLDGMKTVGDLFGAGQMQLPFVLQSAETMKAAVAILEPFMDKLDSESKGTVILATVRGDVHDIGKNLVDIILSNNGYTVVNLGIKQPISAIISAWQEHNADAIGMSGLLVKSTVVMKENLEVLNEREMDPVVILGGAALTRKYVEADLTPIYKGGLHYAKDAFEGLNLMNRIMSGELVASSATPEKAPAVVAEKPAKVADVATPAHSTIARDVAIPTPPFWGAKLVEHIPLKTVLGYMNEKMLFGVQWQYQRGKMTREEHDQFVKTEVRGIYRDLVAKCESQNILSPKAVYGFWPCMAEGDSLLVFDPKNTERELCRFEFPRQRKAPYWCLSDFFRPTSSGEMDVVAFSVVTVGHEVTDVALEWFNNDRYRDYLHLHGLGVETAEALAEYVHKQIRVKLGIADNDAREIPRLLQQKYQGSRYSFGYPACPRLDDQLKLWPLLKPEQVGVTISNEFQLEPEQTTTALVCHHPEAKYFNVR
ncbi:MAG: methionine synthase [Phycisphaerae bacterium]|nr:MAG: methionine synthase [Phycisphaerae bacterium]